MNLVTLNLQGFVDWETRQPRILEYLRRTQPDVILFQEVVFLPEIGSYNQAQLLNQTLGYPYEHSAVTRLQVGLEYPDYREGLAVLSKQPIVRSDTLVLKKDPRDTHNRIIQLIDLTAEGDVYKLANIHFSLTDTLDFATAQLQETLEIFASRHEERVIAGDFNLPDLQSTAPLWSDRYAASSTTPYVSFPSENKRIDYVLLPKSYRFDHVGVSDDGLSDHRALDVQLSLLPASPIETAISRNPQVISL